MSEILILLVISVVAYFGVEVFRRWSLRRELFDVPNQRSSHTTPTPRGGGLIIVVIALLAYLFYSIFKESEISWAYLIGAILVAVISWLDDLRTVSFVWRFFIHIIAALLVIFSTGYFGYVYLPGGFFTVENQIFNFSLTFLWIVWLTNAYNFMDGIDGIAGAQAVCAGLGWLIIGKIIGADSTSFYGGVLAFTAIGFLVHNWQPAKIFMGDVGSAFLGYTLAVLPLLAMREKDISTEYIRYLPLIAVCINWLFVFDTIYTFLRRLVRREKVWEAHRSHIYQKFVIGRLSHRKVTTIYALISALIITFLIIWTIRRGLWETVLYVSILTQTVGLLLYLYLIQNRKMFVKPIE